MKPLVPEVKPCIWCSRDTTASNGECNSCWRLRTSIQSADQDLLYSILCATRPEYSELFLDLIPEATKRITELKSKLESFNDKT